MQKQSLEAAKKILGSNSIAKRIHDETEIMYTLTLNRRSSIIIVIISNINFTCGKVGE